MLPQAAMKSKRVGLFYTFNDSTRFTFIFGGSYAKEDSSTPFPVRSL